MSNIVRVNQPQQNSSEMEPNTIDTKRKQYNILFLYFLPIVIVFAVVLYSETITFFKKQQPSRTICYILQF